MVRAVLPVQAQQDAPQDATRALLAALRDTCASRCPLGARTPGAPLLDRSHGLSSTQALVRARCSCSHVRHCARTQPKQPTDEAQVSVLPRFRTLFVMCLVTCAFCMLSVRWTPRLRVKQVLPAIYARKAVETRPSRVEESLPRRLHPAQRTKNIWEPCPTLASVFSLTEARWNTVTTPTEQAPCARTPPGQFVS